MYLMRFYGFGRGMYWMWDPTYLLIVIGVVLSMVASAMVHSSFSKYSQVRSASGLTGAETARRILAYAGITDVSISHVSGNLTDHYNPKTKDVGLSDSVSSNMPIHMRLFPFVRRLFRWRTLALELRGLLFWPAYFLVCRHW